MANLMLLADGYIFDWGVYSISWLLDTIIYRIAGWTYKVFYVMGRITLDADETVAAITSKIYAILLIFMVFVVAYNMLLYIIDPNKLSVNKDGVGGASNLVKKIAISLIVIVASPLFFDTLYEVQQHVVEYNVIGTIILGGSSSNSSSSDGESCAVSGVSDSGDALVADVYTSFLYPLNGIMASDCCDGSLSAEDMAEDTVTGDYCKAYLKARAKGGVGPFAKIMWDAQKDDSDYQYLAIVSVVAGVAMIIYFLGFCVFLGVRLFKLLALELIAPIPALLDLLPGRSGTLENWFKTVMKVWAQVFVYQVIIFSLVWLATLVPGLLSEINDSINHAASDVTSGFLLLAKVLMILALFQAGIEVPKMIKEVLKIGDGDGILKAAGLKGLGMITAGVSLPGQMVRGAVRGFKSGGAVGGAMGAVGGGVFGLGKNLWGMRNANSWKDIKNTRSQTEDDLKRAAERRAVKRANRKAYIAENSGGQKGFKGAKNVAGALLGDTVERGAKGLRQWAGVEDNFDRRYAKIKQLEEYADYSHVDDRAGRLGEIHKQKDDFEMMLKGTENAYNNLNKEITDGNNFIAAMDRKKAANQQLTAEEEAKYNQYKKDFSWDANQFVEGMNDRIKKTGYKMTAKERAQYELYKEELENNEKLKARKDLSEKIQDLTVQFEAAKTQYEAEYAKSAEKNITKNGETAVNYRDLAKRDEEMAEILKSIKDSNGRTIDALKEIDRFYDNEGKQRAGVSAVEAQEFMETVRKEVKRMKGEMAVENTVRETKNRGANSSSGGNNSNGGSSSS